MARAVMFRKTRREDVPEPLPGEVMIFIEEDGRMFSKDERGEVAEVLGTRRTLVPPGAQPMTWWQWLVLVVAFGFAAHGLYGMYKLGWLW